MGTEAIVGSDQLGNRPKKVMVRLITTLLKNTLTRRTLDLGSQVESYSVKYRKVQHSGIWNHVTHVAHECK